jgi:aminoglycoside phosphotransferase family enzyme
MTVEVFAAGKVAIPEPQLEAKVEFLARPGSYPEHPSAVEVVETHMSLVFLLDRYVYKLKKPVRLPYLDLSTIEARLENSSEEVRLNSRFAPDVYLDVVALTQDDAGRVALGGRGRVVDWLVRMRRLPSKRMLDRVLGSGSATLDDARSLGATLAELYGHERPIRFEPGVYAERLARDVRATAHDLLRLDFESSRVAAIELGQLGFIARARENIEGRAREGRIIEAHGDLRPEHIDLGPPALLIDCLEFDRELRILDPLDELAFLTLECDLRGAAWFGAAVLAAYRTRADDQGPGELVQFYESFRALLRAKLAARRMSDPGACGMARWREKALRYLAHAEAVGATLDRNRRSSTVAVQSV